MKSVALKTALKRDYLIRAASSSHGNILHTVQSSAHMLGCILVSGYLVPFLLAVAAAARQSDRVLMGKRVTRESFVKVDRSSGADDHEVVIGVKQNGLVELDNLLMKLSDPMSSRYQKWLSFDEVTAITANPEGTQAVLDWLSHYGITATRQTVRGDYITAVAPLSTWEEALSTTFHKFADLSPHSPALAQNTFIHRADEYSLPSSMHAHIAAVFNTVQSPPELSGRHPGTRSGVSIDLRGREVQQKSLRSTVRRLYNDDVVTVSFLNDLYGIGTNTGDPTQRQAVFETNYQMFSQDDLRAFQSHFDLPTQPALDPYGYSTTDCVAHSCHEANLDLQYMMGVAQGTQTICWYQGGGDPFVDFVTAVANSTHPPLVNSISWGAVEQSMSADVMDAFNTEALKLAAMGVTVVVSSGDDGVAGRADRCGDDSGSDNSDWQGAPWTGRGYFPSFPATSPYVTAVGATMGPENGDPEIACQSQLGGVITTGGGFSTYNPTPSWQTDAVNAYFDALDGRNTPTSGFNRHGRGYPDVSLIGVRYQVVIQGEMRNIYGTSASAPVFAAMISLINAARAANNMTSVGFLNPTLYARGGNLTASIFTDVTSGHNRCCTSGDASAAVCCESVFHSTEGWDPVTGWGSMRLPDLAQAFSVTINASSVMETQSGHSARALRSYYTLTLVVIASLMIFICTATWGKTTLPVPADAVLVEGELTPTETAAARALTPMINTLERSRTPSPGTAMLQAIPIDLV